MAKIKVGLCPALLGLIIAIVSAQANATTTATTTDELLDAASESGYSRADMEQVLELLNKAIEQEPDNAEVHNFLARAWLTVGRGDLAAPHVAACIEKLPRNASCRFIEVMAMQMRSGDSEALELARRINNSTDGFDRGMQTPFHLTYVDLLWRSGDLKEAEAVLDTVYVGLAELAEVMPEDIAEDRRVPLHPAIALAHIYEAGGHQEMAEGLRAHVAVAHAELKRRIDGGEKLAGFQLWNLAATGAGVADDVIVLGYLEDAVSAGFLMDWRYNIANHPVFWPVRNHPKFQALINGLEERMRSISFNQ